MAIGYEKLNSSSARSLNRAAQLGAGTKFEVTRSGSRIWSPMYGIGSNVDEFISDSDQVKCQYKSGYIVTHRGGSVRLMMKDYLVQLERNKK